MAWDDHAKLLAIKAIGTVETNLTYHAINYSDPITVGIAQWYGTRAANVLNQMRATPSWTGVALSLTNDLAANSETSASYWTNRWLTKAEGTSLRGVLTSTDGVQIQNKQFVKDLEDYAVAGRRVGIDPDANTNAFIYFAAMYHQSPKYARQVALAAGSGSSMDRLHSVALNHSWYSRFRSRQNTVRSIVLSGDVSGVPDTGFEVGDDDYDGGDNGSGALTPAGGSIRNVQLVGNHLHINVGGSIVVAYPTSTGQFWVTNPANQPDSGTPIVGPDVGGVDPGTPVDEKIRRISEWLLANVGRFQYSQGAGRDRPESSGVSDCSALLAYAYKKFAGIHVGTYTVDQQRYGKAVWSNLPGNSAGNSRGSNPPLSVLKEGDLIYFGWSKTFSRVNHVEYYLGNNRLIGHGGPGAGPTIKPDALKYFQQAPYIIVRRHL